MIDCPDWKAGTYARLVKLSGEAYESIKAQVGHGAAERWWHDQHATVCEYANCTLCLQGIRHGPCHGCAPKRRHWRNMPKVEHPTLDELFRQAERSDPSSDPKATQGAIVP